jgi:hypothetical protein
MGGMKRNLAGWGVMAAGLSLAGGGLYAMWTGWDMILLERGWSLFIAGSMALSGGVVTIALGRVIAHLAQLGPQPLSELAKAAAPMVEKTGAPAAPPMKPAPPEKLEPKEVDRYTADGATYVMYSDGSVEVLGPKGAHRYPSLAALRDARLR